MSVHHPTRELPSRNAIDVAGKQIVGGLKAPAILDKASILAIQLHRESSPHTQPAIEVYRALCGYFGVPLREWIQFD